MAFFGLLGRQRPNSNSLFHAPIHEGVTLSIWFGYYKQFLRSFKLYAVTNRPKSTRKYLLDVYILASSFIFHLFNSANSFQYPFLDCSCNPYGVDIVDGYRQVNCSSSGKCQCKSERFQGSKCLECGPGFFGSPKCEQCAPDYYGYPDCKSKLLYHKISILINMKI